MKHHSPDSSVGRRGVYEVMRTCVSEEASVEPDAEQEQTSSIFKLSGVRAVVSTFKVAA